MSALSDSNDLEEDKLSDAPGDKESVCMEEDKGEEQQEDFISTFKKPTLTPKALLLMSMDIDVMEA